MTDLTRDMTATPSLLTKRSVVSSRPVVAGRLVGVPVWIVFRLSAGHRSRWAFGRALASGILLHAVRYVPTLLVCPALFNRRDLGSVRDMSEGGLCTRGAGDA